MFQETSICATVEMVANQSRIIGAATAPAANFPTQAFYMTMHALHCGIVATAEKFANEFVDGEFA